MGVDQNNADLQSPRLLDHDRDCLSSSSSRSSDLDIEDEAHSTRLHTKGARRRRAYVLGRLVTLQCPTLSRRHKLLLLLITLLVVPLSCLVVFGKQHIPRSLRVPPEPQQSPPPPHPKPTFCSTWPAKPETIKRDSQWRRAQLPSDRVRRKELSARAKWKKPAGLKIIATVFYGRRRNVDVLDCYLQKNLARNGGSLDEVHFMIHTADEQDRAWIEKLAGEVEDYEAIDLGDCTHKPYGCIWDFIADPDVLYIKIDDDIAFIHEDTIPRLVQTRQQQKEAFAISANLVNSPLTGYLHFHHGAIHPFLPDPARYAYYATSATDWRVSALPTHTGNKTLDLDAGAMEPPFRGHRWLPVSNDDLNLDNMMTPMGRVDNWGGTQFALALHSWAAATQQHYSLLKNVEQDTMSRYHFGVAVGASDALWNTQYTRYNLNFVAIWGADVRANLPIPSDDEHAISHSLPRKLARPVFIDTKAVVAHLHFGMQIEGLLMTDVLDRYRALANEMVCASDNQKVPLDERCEWVEGADEQWA